MNKKEKVDDSEDPDDDDEVDDDAPMECNQCYINGIQPGYVTEDFDDLLRHIIWNDHKENSKWGPAH